MTIPTGQRRHIDDWNAQAREAAQATRRRLAYAAKVVSLARKWLAEGTHPRVAAERLGCDADWLLRRM